MDKPKLIVGNLSIDDRGEVGFVNEFDLAGVKRFYSVANHHRGFVRAWHGHKHEAKYVTVVQGAALVGVVAVTDWRNPARDAPVFRCVLSAHQPAILFIPPSHCNGFMSLTPEAKLIFFSTATLEESRNDDYRFPARYWDIWQVEER
jgi:dTDP-4-dehydrorhamnose 3,5-epimerase